MAEMMGFMNAMLQRLIEKPKIYCAREWFRAISSSDVVYDVADSCKALLDKVMKKY